jgi:uncharacterized protein with HEPN domain
MAQRTVRERLSDIANAIEKIQLFIADYSLVRFSQDARTHVEASRHVPADLKSETTEIAWRQIVDFGNLLRHGYDGVDDAIIWDTIKRDLPPLLAAIRGFLSRPDII